MHDTLLRLLEPPLLGLRVTDQARPSQDSTKVSSIVPSLLAEYSPTATQSVELMHDTPARPLPKLPLPAAESIDQTVPFQDSIRLPGGPPFESVPTAMQLAELVQDTLLRLLASNPGLGLEMDDHVVPFHDSTNVRIFFPGLEPRREPTAWQLIERLHDTPRRSSLPLPGLGLGATDHDVPFQTSIRVWFSGPELLLYHPTAMHSVERVHETPWSSLSELLWSGLAVMDHSVPFQVSISV
jgi:hypothetical protein